jgi:flavodoxin
MKALIIYDSFFSNTRKIAEAIEKSLGGNVIIPVVKATDVKPEDLIHLDYLIAGSPTRAFQPTPTIMKILRSIPAGGLKGTKVAAFDTRMDVKESNNGFLTFMVGMFGYAAGAISRILMKKGGMITLPPEGFFVKGTEGPLKEEELERVAAWTKQILNSR